jgi:MFS family permease
LQVVTGPLSDRWGRKGLIATGMWVQAVGLFAVATLDGFGWWVLGSVLLGVGTAIVYPCLLAAVSDAADPSWRARALSVYRFWRDLGYAIGALSAGLLAAIVGFAWTIAAIGLLTFISGVVVAALMRDSHVTSRRSVLSAHEKENGMSEGLLVNAVALRNEVKAKYRDVADQSARQLPFPYGTPAGATIGLRRDRLSPNA